MVLREQRLCHTRWDYKMALFSLLTWGVDMDILNIFEERKADVELQKSKGCSSQQHAYRNMVCWKLLYLRPCRCCNKYPACNCTLCHTVALSILARMLFCRHWSQVYCHCCQHAGFSLLVRNPAFIILFSCGFGCPEIYSQFAEFLLHPRMIGLPPPHSRTGWQ